MCAWAPSVIGWLGRPDLREKKNKYMNETMNILLHPSPAVRGRPNCVLWMALLPAVCICILFLFLSIPFPRPFFTHCVSICHCLTLIFCPCLQICGGVFYSILIELHSTTKSAFVLEKSDHWTKTMRPETVLKAFSFPSPLPSAVIKGVRTVPIGCRIITNINESKKIIAKLF